MLRTRTRSEKATRSAYLADRADTWREAGLLTSGPAAPRKRRAMRRRREEPRRSERERDPAYLAWIRTLTCAAAHLPGHRCDGRIEADHVGVRPLGRKSDDVDTIALCSLAHRQRTDHCGPFRDFTREDMRAFVAGALAITADAWRRHTAAEPRGEAD